MWTAIQIEYYDPEKKIWETCVNYYKGDLTAIDINTNWRTHDVEKKRRNAKILGIDLNFDKNNKQII